MLKITWIENCADSLCAKIQFKLKTTPKYVGCWCRDFESFPDVDENTTLKFRATKSPGNKKNPRKPKKPKMSTKIPTLGFPSQKNITVAELDNPDFRYEPNEAFKVDCNTCWCSQSGKEPKSCTRIACNPKVYASLPKEFHHTKDF